MLNSEWSELELICLQSDLNNGLGFGLLGNKTTGVLVRNIVPGGNADSVGNLRPGDLIMRVGDVSTRGMGPDQVARLLRQAMMTSFAHAASTSGETMVSHPASVSSFSTSHSTSSISAASTSVSGGLPVRLVVSRPAQGRPAALAEVYEEQNRQISQRQPLGPLCIVPTEALDEPLDHLTDLMLPQAPPTTTQAEVNTRPRVPSTATDTASEVPNSVTKTTDVHESSSSQEMQSELIQPPSLPPNDDDDNLSFDTTQAITPSTSITSPIVSVDEQSQPNEALESCVEFSVLLRKPPGGQNVGLGLIIVGYVSGDPDHHPVKDRSVTGIFVKDILPNGLASASGKIKPHDQIIKVNGVDLKTLSNKAAANLLKHSGPVVHLTFLRHTSGQVCEQLKQLVSPPTRPSRTCRALATLPFGLCRRPQKRRSRRNCETTAHPTYSANSLKPLAIYIPSNHQKPFGVCPAQSEILVAPELNSEESDDSICRVPRETAPVAGSWTCQSLPVLYANLREPSPSPTSCETEAILQSSTPSVFQGEQTTSSTAASLTLNSSPLEETDETEESTADTSSMHSRLNWTIGMIESVYLRAAVHFAGRAPPELIKLMVDVWTPIVGPNKEIMVIRTVRPKNMRVLGISLQGSTLLDASESTPDKLSEAAAEDDATATASPSRHFVHSVLPNSLFGQLGCLQRGDEILQVNGYRLHGYSHVEAVRCLRCLPSHIELVIARSLDAGHDEGQYFMEDVDGNTTLQVAASEIGSTLTGLEDGAGGSTRKDSGDWLGVSPVALPNQPPDLRVSEWIHRSHSDITSTKMMLNGSADLHEAPTSPPTSSMSLSAVSKADDSLLSLDNTRMSTLLRSMKVQRNRLDPSGATSMLLPGSDLKPTWSKVPLIVMLRRDTKGFGFSLSEFDDFAVSTTTVRTSSLRRRASTLTRRRTVAGDMNLTPDRVSTLPRSATAAGGTLSRPRRSVLLIDLIQPGGCVDRDGRLAVGDRLLFVNDRKLSKASLGEAATVLQNVPLGYTMIGVAKMKLVHATPQPPVESLSSPQFAALVSSDDKSLPLQDEFAKEYAKDHPLDFYSPLTLHLDDMPYHASTLKVPGIDVNDETVVRVKTNGLPLGLELDALAAGGQDGCRVVKVLRGGAVEKAAALVPGDYITRINSDTLRCVSNAEAFRVLRKVSVECSTIEIAYYPAEKVLDHRAKHMKVGSLGVDSAPEASFNDASDSKASTSAIVSLIEDLPPPELILTTTPLLLEAPSAGACWTQTREIKLLKLPHEATWGIFITGPDMWGNNEDEAKLPPLPPEVSQPVFISKIGDDTAASRCGLLESGDIVIGVNGMDATRVGSRTVAEWLQTANFVSTSASSSSASDNESPQTAEWAFLYLLVLSFRSGTSSSSPSSGRRAVDLQSIPPVALFGDMTSSGGDFDCKSRPVSFLGHPGTLVRSAFISSNESSSMEEPTSVASLEQHGDIPEPLALSDLAITPPKGHDMPPLPANGTLDSSDGGFASLAYHHPVAPPIPSVQTVESQSAWRNIGSTKLTSSLAQLTETYRRPALVDDEIHVVTLSLAAARCGGSSTADCEATLGIRLVGHRDTNLRGVFVCSLREKSLADQTPGLQVTDEIVQVNNVCVMGLTHVSAKLLISKEAELARRGTGGGGGEEEAQILLVIRHNVVYNSSVMARPAAGTTPTACSHFLHNPTFAALRASSSSSPSNTTREASPLPCPSTLNGAAALPGSKKAEYEFIEVTIERNAKGGFGLCLVNMNQRRELGVFVQNPDPTSPAGLSGQVKSWDRIVAINGEAVDDYDTALAKLTLCRPRAQLRLARLKSPAGVLGTISEGVRRPTLPRGFSPHTRPTPILRGVETTVEMLRSPGEELGFSIVGGADTLMGGVFIHQVHNGSFVWRDGRLKPGDQILAVGDLDLRQSNHAAATKALRETQERVLITILRGAPSLEDTASTLISLSAGDMLQTFNVTLQKQPGQAFGLVLDDIPGGVYTGGVVIVDVADGSPASRSSVLASGDVILEVDGIDVHKASFQDVTALLKQRSTHVMLKTGRPKPPSGQAMPRLRLFTVLLTRPPLQGIGGASTSAPSFRALVVDAHVPGVFGLILRAATDGELSCAPGNLVVDSIVPDSPAARSGMLQIGDRLLGIDREPVGWLTVADVERFARPYDSLTFEFGRLPPLHSRTSTYSSPSDHLVFDAYDFGLGTLREGEVVRASSPISVNPVRYHPEPAAGANQRAAGDPIRPSGRNDSTSVTATTYNYEVDEEEEEDKEVEDMGNGVNIRQIQLPFVPQSSSNDVRPHPRLGLSISAGKGSSSGQWVVGVTPNSPAAQSGLRVGDCILGLDDRLLIACGGHDSAKVLQAIETAWASRLPTTDAQQVTLTVLRQAPVSLPTAAEKKSPFPQFDVPTRRSDALLPPQYFRANRRYPKDVGDNLDVHLQAAPPGLLTPLMVGVTAGAVGGALYRGAVDDPVGQTYFHPPGESGDHVAVATNGFSLDAGDSHATNYDDIVEREALFEDHDADGDLFHKGDGDYDNGNENFDQGNSMESPEPLDYRGDGAEDTY